MRVFTNMRGGLVKVVLAEIVIDGQCRNERVIACGTGGTLLDALKLMAEDFTEAAK
jgi:phosphoheptose isomerase